MRISTLITVFNVERYIAQALDSVLTQTRLPEEVIVVDDGSTDQTPSVLASYVDSVHIVTQANLGTAGALNTGLGVATGDVLAFLDGDDIWMPDKLRVQALALTEEPQLEAVFGMVRQFVSPDSQDEGQDFDVPDKAQLGVCKSAMLIRRSTFDRIGPFSTEHGASDFFEWYSRANALGLQVRVLPELVALRRHHPNNTGRRFRRKQQQEMLDALKRSLDLRRRQRNANRG